MASQIDDTRPVYGSPTTASVRANFTTAKQEISALQEQTEDGPFLPVAGGAMHGSLLLGADPNGPLEAATRQYVDARVGGIFEAPTDGRLYGRANSSWSPAMPSGPQQDSGRNVILNPMFIINQRGPGPWTSGQMTSDRWNIVVVNDITSVTVAALADADRAAIGDEQAFWTLQAVVNGSGTVGSISYIEQRVEGVAQLSGKQCTLSFWARCNTGTLNLSPTVYQVFGTGGSPSPASTALGVGDWNVVLTPTWTRYSRTFGMPSVATKVFGTNGNDYTPVRFVLSQQGVVFPNYQTGTFRFWGMQLEAGPMTPLAKRPPQQERLACMRYYQTSSVQWQFVSAGISTYTLAIPFLAPMRSVPTMTADWTPAQFNGTGTLGPGLTNYQFNVAATVGAGNGVNVAGNWTASAEL